MERNCTLLFLFTLLFHGHLFGQHVVQGRVFFDQNQNCTWDPQEPLFCNWPIEADKGGLSWYAISDEDGMFEFTLNGGVYDFIPSPPFPQLYITDPCGAVSVTLNSDTVIDIPIYAISHCSELAVDVSTTSFVSNSTATLFISFSNLGTSEIENSKFTIDLDKTMVPLSSSLEFEVDTVADVLRLSSYAALPVGGQPKHAWVEVKVLPGYLDGQPTVTALEGFLTSSNITTCDSTVGVWDGASIVVDGFCNQNDSTIFNITNVGLGNMSGPANYLILQDDILGVDAGSYQLNSGQSQQVGLEGNFSFHRLIAEQSPFHPFLDQQTVLVEACAPEPDPEKPGNAPLEVIDNNSMLMQRELGELENKSTLSIYPSGVCQSSKIFTDERIYFTLLSRNFEDWDQDSVVVRFPIPAELDPATFRMGAQSHQADLSIENFELVWRLQSPILAFGSPNDQDQSVIKFSMLPGQDVEDGDHLITSFTTEMAEDHVSEQHHQLFVDTFTCLLTTANEEWLTSEVTLYPNPATDLVMVRSAERVSRIELTTLDGRSVRFEQEHTSINIQGLPNGIYIVSIETESGVIRKKLVVQH